MPAPSTSSDYFNRCDCWNCGSEDVLLNENNNCRDCEEKVSIENSKEMFDRVRLMARTDTDWDLSDNDTRALKHVLAAASQEWKPIAEAPEGILDSCYCGMYVGGSNWITYSPSCLTAAEMAEMKWTHYCKVKLPEPPPLQEAV